MDVEKWTQVGRERFEWAMEQRSLRLGDKGLNGPWNRGLSGWEKEKEGGRR